MAIAHLLEDFSTRGAVALARVVTEEEWEEHKLSAFEQGYAAGWDDAVAAQSGELAHVSKVLAQNLEDMSFGYHEALAQMVAAAAPVFRAMIDTVLPEAMARSFGQQIVEELGHLVAEAAGQPVVLAVPEGAAAGIAPMLQRDFPMPVDLVEDPRLGDGQASIRLGQGGSEVDCGSVLASVREAVEAFLYHATEETRHG